jgi:hypothetical protein
MDLETTRLVAPDGRELIVNACDVETLLSSGWTRPGAAPKASPAPAAAAPRTSAPRASHRTEPPTAAPADPS